MRRPAMSKTQRFGGDGYFGEIPALKEPEDPQGNIHSGFAEIWYENGDYEEPCTWWVDEAALLRGEVEVELARLRAIRTVPFEEWPLADLKQLCIVLRGY